MNIGDVATRTGLPPKTIRYYEDIGLVTPHRSANGYRVFRDSDAHKLAFLAHARSLGFGIDNFRDLLALWEDEDRNSADVRMIAKTHLAQITAKIAGLQAMEETLTHLVATCAGDNRPECPILRGLADGPETR